VFTFATIPAGQYRLGSTEFYPEEGPEYTVDVDEFALSIAPITNHQFAAFVAETNWVTDAERTASLLRVDDEHGPGSMVFTPTDGPTDLSDWRNWWRWVPGASWRAPQGPESSIENVLDHPVTHVSFDDATAFCEWADVRLPTESEWEVAARGGLVGAAFTWGATDHHGTALRANTWQGNFPWKNDGALGWCGTSPVGTFPPNDYGLVDMAGNVWEWTSSPWTADHTKENQVAGSGCGCGCTSGISDEAFVLKGGSFLCSIDYCFRYRPAARSSQTRDSSTSHIGFRVAKIQ
jgi:formylglycine-generating enzyme required for sulfatase activity